MLDSTICMILYYVTVNRVYFFCNRYHKSFSQLHYKYLHRSYFEFSLPGRICWIITLGLIRQLGNAPAHDDNHNFQLFMPIYHRTIINPEINLRWLRLSTNAITDTISSYAYSAIPWWLRLTDWGSSNVSNRWIN